MMHDSFDRIKWAKFKEIFKSNYGEYPSLISGLFLVGLEQIPDVDVLTKEQKQEVIHVGLCKLLAQDNLYTVSHYDNDGWPHFALSKHAKQMDIEKQENYIKQLLINYFFP